MTNEQAQALAHQLWGDPAAALHQPHLGAGRAFMAGGGEGHCWEQAFFRAGVDPATIVVAIRGPEPEDDEDPRPGRQKTPRSKALDVLAEIIGVTPQALARSMSRRGRQRGAPTRVLSMRVPAARYAELQELLYAALIGPPGALVPAALLLTARARPASP